MEREIFEKICRQLDLGSIEYSPVPLKGGFMHKMYSLFTAKGRYAVKLLNPFVMQREHAMENYHSAEELEIKLEQYHIPVLPAMTFAGRKMQEIDGRFFYLYEWYDGKAVKNEEITEAHCEKIGRVLAKIHGIESRSMPFKRNEIHIIWESYLDKMAVCNEEIYNLLKQNCSMFYEMQDKGNRAIRKIPSIVSICHNDLDSKNVLWNGKECRVIDLECLSYSSPFIELYETALRWSGYDNCNIDYRLFNKLIGSYQEVGGCLPMDWQIIYDSNYGSLEWLEYNVKRVLGIECVDEEREIGLSEVRNTIAQIAYYHEKRNEIVDCLKRVSREMEER